MLFSGIHRPYCKEVRDNVKDLEDIISYFNMHVYEILYIYYTKIIQSFQGLNKNEEKW